MLPDAQSVDNLLIGHGYFYSMHLTFTAQCGTKLDHSEMLRLVRHPIHIFTASPSGSFQHALWALSPLKCCSWHQPAKLACKLAATPERENNSSSDQNSPQPFHLHARQRVLYRKCLTDNNVAEQWLKTFKNDYNFRSGVLSLLCKRLGLRKVSNRSKAMVARCTSAVRWAKRI